MQRLYKRRRPSTEEDLEVTKKTTGPFASNWDVFKYGVYNSGD